MISISITFNGFAIRLLKQHYSPLYNDVIDYKNLKFCEAQKIRGVIFSRENFLPSTIRCYVCILWLASNHENVNPLKLNTTCMWFTD